MAVQSTHPHSCDTGEPGQDKVHQSNLNIKRSSIHVTIKFLQFVLHDKANLGGGLVEKRLIVS
jgi:hypothetical protein